MPRPASTMFWALFVAVPLLLPCVPLTAQEPERRWNVTVMAGAGYMAHGAVHEEKLARSFWYPTADLRVGYQTSSDDPASYAALFNFPTVGLGVNWKGSGHFDWVGKSHLSDLLSVYGFFEQDFIRTRVFSFGYDVSLGLGFNNAVYDKVENPDNDIFSSAMALYVGPSLRVAFRPVRHLELGLAGRYTHLSTGRLAYPNMGFNGLEVTASARYALEEPRLPVRRDSPKADFKKRMLYEIYAGYGAHRCSLEWEATGKTTPWPTYTFGTSACYQYSPILSSGLSLDFFCFPGELQRCVARNELILYPELHPEQYDYRPLCVGISAMQQLHYGNFTAWVQVGAYLYKHLGVMEQPNGCYQRIGGKVVFPRLANTYLGVSCKAHYFSRAASLDFILGVRI